MSRFSTLEAYQRDLDRRCSEADDEEDELTRYPVGCLYGDALRRDRADRDMADIARIERKHQVQARMLRRRG